MHAEYGHVAGARDFFARLARAPEDARRGERRLARYLDTHPLHADRVAALAAEAARARLGDRRPAHAVVPRRAVKPAAAE